jgi:hypothetical protein
MDPHHSLRCLSLAFVLAVPQGVHGWERISNCEAAYNTETKDGYTSTMAGAMSQEQAGRLVR